MTQNSVSPRISTCTVGIIILFAAVFWFVAASLARQWLDDPNYTHGLFVVPMAFLLAWRRRGKLVKAPRSLWSPGIIVVAIAGAIYLLGIAAAELFTQRFAMVLTAIGLFSLTQGKERTRVLAFPLAFLLLMLPLPYIIYYRLTFPLQLESSRLTAALLSGLGMPVVRTGNVIHLENYNLEVVTACSGLRSMMTLGTLAIFASDFLHTGSAAKVLLVALSVPVAVAANTVRLAVTAIVSALGSPEAADNFFHQFSGIVVFLSGLVLLVAAGLVLEWIAKRKAA
jgi:exosortase